MRAFAVLENSHTVSTIKLPRPAASGHEVVLRVEHVGVCHTDTHLQDGEYDLGSRGVLRLVDRGFRYPLVMGHEVVAVVEDVGNLVTTALPGDRRLVFPWIGCGACHWCLLGQENRCADAHGLGVQEHGGYAEYIWVPHEKYLIDIAGIDPVWAATLACSGLTAFGAVNRVLPLPAGQVVAVIGAGGLGLTAISLLRALGHADICAVDISPDNLLAAQEMGATSSLLLTGDDLGTELASTCGGPLAAVIDFVNNGTTAAGGFTALQKGGQLVQVGLFGGEFLIPTALMPLKMLTLHGAYAGTLAELKSLVTLAQRGALPHIPITNESLTEQSIRDTLDRLRGGKAIGRIVLSSSTATASP